MGKENDGDQGGMIAMGARVPVDAFVGRGRRHGGHPDMAPSDGCHAMDFASFSVQKGKGPWWAGPTTVSVGYNCT